MTNNWEYKNGTWYVSKITRAELEQSKTKTASKTAPKLSTQTTRTPSSPASGTSRYGLLYDLKVLWRGLSSPWFTVSFATLLGISVAYNLSYYLENKYLMDIIVKSGILQ